jgi:large subunit ribosomal protein L24
MSIARIKKDDVVIAISGVNLGQVGRVKQLNRRDETAIVEGFKTLKRTQRRTQENPNGGIIEIEVPVRLCKLMPYDNEGKKGVRISRVVRDGKRVRQAKGSGRILD